MCGTSLSMMCSRTALRSHQVGTSDHRVGQTATSSCVDGPAQTSPFTRHTAAGRYNRDRASGSSETVAAAAAAALVQYHV